MYLMTVMEALLLRRHAARNCYSIGLQRLLAKLKFSYLQTRSGSHEIYLNSGSSLQPELIPKMSRLSGGPQKIYSIYHGYSPYNTIKGEEHRWKTTQLDACLVDALPFSDMTLARYISGSACRSPRFRHVKPVQLGGLKRLKIGCIF